MNTKKQTNRLIIMSIIGIIVGVILFCLHFFDNSTGVTWGLDSSTKTISKLLDILGIVGLVVIAVGIILLIMGIVKQNKRK